MLQLSVRDASTIPYITNVLYSPAPSAQFVGRDVTGAQDCFSVRAVTPNYCNIILASWFASILAHSQIVLQAVARAVPDLISTQELYAGFRSGTQEREEKRDNFVVVFL